MLRALLFVLPLLLLTTEAWAARIAVLDFTNASTDASLAPLGKGLQSMLTTDLSQVSALTLVERERLQDITAELELGTSTMVDTKTAARIGKLAGASHLLVGSFTVLGDAMRLDARLVGVESGAVVLAETIDGETEAFFELEQDLVKALVKALQIDLEPKERAGIRRIHTADFEAFRQFSRGIDRFDAEAYDDALDALRDATTRDEDFKLARVTLKEYERLIEQLRTRSATLETSKKELERLKKLQEADDQAAVLARLWAIADADPSSDADAGGTPEARRRSASLYLLAVAYGNVGRNKGKLLRLRRLEDQFAMERSADALHQAFFDESAPRWPELPLVVTDRFWRGLPEVRSKDGGPPDEPFDERFASLAEHLFEYGADYPANRRKYLLDDLRSPDDMARRLHLDRAETVELFRTFFERARDLEPEDYWVDDFEERLAESFRAVLRLDESTRLYAARAERTDNPYALKGITAEIETNRDYQRLLDQAKNKALVREWLLLAQDEGWSRGPIVKFGTEQLAGPIPTFKGLQQLAKFREFPSRKDQFVLVGDVPVWVLQGKRDVVTGPRSDPHRAASLRYYRDEAPELAPMFVLGGVPTAAPALSFAISRDPADDWTTPRRRVDDGPFTPDPGAPELTVLFGIEDVAVEKRKDEATGEYVLPRPTKLWAVAFEGGTVHLLRGVETDRGSYGRKEGFAWAEHAMATLPLKGAVSVEVRGRTVRVSSGAKTVSLALPEDPPRGFVGLQFGGTGYLEVGRLRLRVGDGG